MRAKEAITELWKTGYFEKEKTTKRIEQAILKKYGTTCSNIFMVLKICNFLRKTRDGWIQKMRYSEDKEDNTRLEDQTNYFRLLSIHPEIQKVSKRLFIDGHYAQAIFEAFKRVNNLVKEKSERKDLDGKSLMLHVFSPNNPVLRFNDLQSQTDKDEQEGFMHLFAGAMSGIRNPKGHENIVQTDKFITLEYLMFASLLCKRLENTTKV
jgi:uncharacterized protein (TIGR02391 family)